MPQSEHVLCCHDTRLTTPIRYDRGNRSSAGADAAEGGIVDAMTIADCPLRAAGIRRHDEGI